jgi:triphosphatase
LPHLRALKPAPVSLVAAIIQARAKAYDAACDYISSPAYGQLVLGLLAWLHTGDWRSAAGKARLAALDHAGDTLERLRKKLQKRSRGLAQMGEAQIHELRIQAKKLRYAAEMFASLYPNKTQIRRKWVSAIKTLQDQLGAANDRAVGQGLLIAHAPKATSDQIDHWISALWPRPKDTPAKAQKTLDMIFDLPCYWRENER